MTHSGNEVETVTLQTSCASTGRK